MLNSVIFLFPRLIICFSSSMLSLTFTGSVTENKAVKCFIVTEVSSITDFQYHLTIVMTFSGVSNCSATNHRSLDIFKPRGWINYLIWILIFRFGASMHCQTSTRGNIIQSAHVISFTVAHVNRNKMADKNS